MGSPGILGELAAFVPSLDLGRAREFYEATLGLQLVSADDYALVLSSGPTQIRVTAVPDLTPHPFTVLGWTVDDIDAAVQSLGASGVEFVRFEGMEQNEHGVWNAPGGARVSWFRDPDGNTLSITQLA